MASNFADLIQSHQFTFLVGPEEQAVVVHSGAIAATSPQLNALVNNGMRESEERRAKLDDVRVDDFIRFCEYAYRGDYTVPACEIMPEPTPQPEEVQEASYDEWGSHYASSSKKKGRKGKVALWDEPTAAPEPEPESEPVLVESAVEKDDDDGSWPNDDLRPKHHTSRRTQLRSQFNSRTYPEGVGPKTLILQQFEPRFKSADNQSFAPVFLAHARLFYFAQVRLIAPLKALALEKLHKTLMGFKLYSKRVGDIIELARYAYSNPDLPDGSDGSVMEELKKLVVEYMVCEIDVIGQSDEFVAYMEEGGEFVGDFWRMARNYMC